MPYAHDKIVLFTEDSKHFEVANTGSIIQFKCVTSSGKPYQATYFFEVPLELAPAMGKFLLRQEQEED